MLLAMPVLMASPEMKQAAIEDVPQKKVTYYGREYTERRYFTYLNCQVQDGILKVAFYMPDCLRLNGDQPVYEVFLDKKNRQFLTYDYLARKWRDAKLDRLEWPGREYASECWISEENSTIIQNYFSGERGGYYGILDFQRKVREEQLNRYHKRITDPWDNDLAQVPKLPKDWGRWADKVAVRRISSSIATNAAAPKLATVLSAKRKFPLPGIPTTTRKAAAPVAGILSCSKHWDAQVIFRQISIMLI